MIVLKYIANKTQRFFTFVANQVAIIRHESEPEEKRKNEDEWPPQATEASEALLDSDEGVEREKIMVGAAVAQKDFWSSLFQRYSKWDRLQRLVAWLVSVFHSFISVRSD